MEEFGYAVGGLVVGSLVGVAIRSFVETRVREVRRLADDAAKQADEARAAAEAAMDEARNDRQPSKA